uniref:MMS1_N domain-containing protein n=1 Tax=Hymenolepis diminuta TaxID=6216 RepID=A0A0R3SC53_HYMDI
LNESWDGDVKEDIEMLLNRLIPENLKYKHACEGPDDMPAHAKHAILSGSNVTIPITDGKMNLGTWQGIWFIEHRNQKSKYLCI